jgi:hypothetical protein
MRTGEWARAALVLIVLVGCSDPAKPGTLPSGSPSVVVTSTSVAPTASVTSDVLVARVREFYATLESASRMPASGTDEVAALMTASCPCQQIVAFLRDLAKQGRHIERPVHVLDPQVASATRTGGTVFLTLQQDAGRVVDARGHTVETLRPSRDRLVIDLQQHDGALLIAQISVREP